MRDVAACLEETLREAASDGRGRCGNIAASHWRHAPTLVSIFVTLKEGVGPASSRVLLTKPGVGIVHRGGVQTARQSGVILPLPCYSHAAFTSAAARTRPWRRSPAPPSLAHAGELPGRRACANGRAKAGEVAAGDAHLRHVATFARLCHARKTLVRQEKQPANPGDAPKPCRAWSSSDGTAEPVRKVSARRYAHVQMASSRHVSSDETSKSALIRWKRGRGAATLLASWREEWRSDSRRRLAVE